MVASAGWGVQAAWPAVSAAEDAALAGLGEGALVQACVEGRPGAFDLVVARHQRSIYRLCWRFTGNHEDASDLAQDVFLRAFRALATFRGQASLATWLYRVAVNVCLNRAAAKSSMPLATEPIEADLHADTSADSPADRLLRAERQARVRSAIAALPPKQRAALVLRVYHELSHQEIADVMGTSVGAVKANCFHALSTLKKRLGPEGV